MRRLFEEGLSEGKVSPPPAMPMSLLTHHTQANMITELDALTMGCLTHQEPRYRLRVAKVVALSQRVTIMGGKEPFERGPQSDLWL